MVSIAIQAGGLSRRMGQDKGLLRLAGIPLVEHVLHRVRSLGDECLITTNRPQAYAYLGLPMASDPEPGLGALVGLRTALAAARHETVLVLACDMPFVQPDLLAHLLQQADQADVVVPRRGGEYEPLHAVYARACLPRIQARLEGGESRMISFFPDVRVLAVEEATLTTLDPTGLSFFNVNTPDDLLRAEQLLNDPSIGFDRGSTP